MTTIECPHRRRSIIPKVTQGRSGMHSQVCPLCGKNIAGFWNQDVQQITFTPIHPRLGLIILALLALLGVATYLFIWPALSGAL